MFEYMTAQETANKWNVSLRWVQRLCKENRIEGVMNVNRVWLIPKDAKMVHYTLDNTATTNAITARLEEIDGNLVIKFDYLNPDYQIAASILHENPDAEFEVTGSALNVNEITREWSDRQVKFWGLWSLGILYFILLLFYIYNHRPQKKIRI